MTTKADHHCYLGIDVGTGSARAGVFDASGNMLAAAAREIQIWRPQTDFVEQSSDDIWRAVCAAVSAAMADAGVKRGQVRGLGFDATCSLVALDTDDKPVTVSPSGRDEQNVIVWMDHRAMAQTARINATRHQVLEYVGGTISPEMETPKLLWLKENLPASWRRTARFFDLPDFLVYQATGDDTRSLCSTVCKWTYLGHVLYDNSKTPGAMGKPSGLPVPGQEDTGKQSLPMAPSGADSRQTQVDARGAWDDSFFRRVGLGDLVDEGFRRIGTRVRPMGEPVGRGLTGRAARELGLNPGTAVGVSIIDAHAGGLGVLGASVPHPSLREELGTREGAPSPAQQVMENKTLTPEQLETRIALIGGTSSCHMAVSREARFIPGVWGPYYSAMIPGMWLTEGGQSATGALVDHVISSHARAADLRAESQSSGKTVYELLNDCLDRLAETGVAFPAQLTRELHVLPYFHGNRSPRADATLRGMISGLTLGDTLADLALLYLATIQAIAHGTRHIIDTMNEHGYRIDTVFACGGGTRNPVFLREHADVTGCRIVLPREPEAVLLGAAILGAVASGDHASLLSAMTAMNAAAEITTPATGAVADYHTAKHAVYLRMYEDQLAYRGLMK